MNELTRQDLIEKVEELIADYDARQLDTTDIEGLNGEQLDCISESLQFAQVITKNIKDYFCAHCNQGVHPNWKHCARCGEKIVWKDKRNLK